MHVVFILAYKIIKWWLILNALPYMIMTILMSNKHMFSCKTDPVCLVILWRVSRSRDTWSVMSFNLF